MNSWLRSAVTLSAAILIGLPFSAIAGVNTWTRVGPDVGTIGKASWSASDNSVVWASSNEYIYRSTDSGATWTGVGTTPDYGTFCDIAADPADASEVYVVTCDNNFRVMKSDGTSTTYTIDSSGGDARVQNIAVSGNTLYGGGQGTGVWTSTDGGKTWTQTAASGLPHGVGIYAIAASLVSQSTAWVSVWADGVYYTTDGGATWNQSSGLPITTFKVLPDPSNVSNVFAVTPDGIYKSTDGGANWTIDNTGITGTVADLAYVANDSKTLYAVTDEGDVYQSFDAGSSSWNLFNGTLVSTGLSGIWANPSTGKVIAAGWEGSFITSGNGTYWTSATGIQNVKASSLGIADNGQARIFLADQKAGIYVSEDGSATWRLNHEGLTRASNDAGYEAMQLAVPIGGHTAWLASDQLDEYLPTISLGWVDLTTEPVHGYYRKIAVGDTFGTHVMASYYDDQTFQGISVTWDGGSWYEPGTFAGQYVEALAYDPQDDNIAYAASNDTGVWKSEDAGATWTQIDNNPHQDIRSIVVDPTDSNTIYYSDASSGLGIHKSTDGGATWTTGMSNATYPYVTALAIDQKNHNVLIAGTRNGGVYRSIDGGDTWANLTAGMDYALPNINAIAFNPTDPSIIYAASERQGLVRYSIEPELGVSITGNAQSADTGTTISVTLTADSNLSKVAPTDVVVTADIPSGLTVSNLPSTCSNSSHTVVTCALGTLAGEKTFTFDVTSATAGSYAIDASISSAETDVDPSNNSSSLSVSFTAPASSSPSPSPTPTPTPSKSGNSSSSSGGGGSFNLLILALLGSLPALRKKKT